MTLISTAELAAIQEIGRSGLASTATILARTTVRDDNGQHDEWPTTGPTVACWVYEVTPLGTTLGLNDGGAALSELFHVRVPFGTNVDSGDHLVLSGFPGNRYVVQHTNDDSTYPVWLDCAVRRLVPSP